MSARRGTGQREAAPRARDKRVGRRRAAEEVARAQQRGEAVVFTNGCFDLVHVGHLRCLEAARRLGDRLLVAVNDDDSVRALKGPTRPILPARQRAELIAGLACVDWVVVFREQTPLALIRATRPDILAKGGDWALDEIVGREDIESWGGRVARIREVPELSTSHIVEQIRKRKRS